MDYGIRVYLLTFYAKREKIIHRFHVERGEKPMKDFESKMPVSRQIRYYKQSRDNWKENAAQKQIKIREYVQSTRS